ncbi:hypothetical protein BC833DRAFT_625727 [Globomyces pollinis-pini]|nr:hypothetical protein BC833DRAFT_625727 [Globomyces pollinis-pini]
MSIKPLEYCICKCCHGKGCPIKYVGDYSVKDTCSVYGCSNTYPVECNRYSTQGGAIQATPYKNISNQPSIGFAQIETWEPAMPVFWIVFGSACGFVVILGFLSFIFLHQHKGKRTRQSPSMSSKDSLDTLTN